MKYHLIAFLCSNLVCASSWGAVKEKFAPIYVNPYYSAGKTETEPPTVKTYKGHDHLLASMKKEDLLKVRAQIEATPDNITAITMFVLSTRLYDLGLKWDSVLWFYIAKNRHFETIHVLNPQSLGGAPAASDAFISLLGPYVNGFAFCDIKKQQETLKSALAWTRKHPYGAVFIESLPALGPNRNALREEAINKLEIFNSKEIEYFKDPKNLKEFQDQRKKNNADEKYCD